MTILLPRHGNAVFDHLGNPIHSAHRKGAILECNPALRVFGPRQHLALFIDKTKFIGHLTHMLDRNINGRIDFHPHIDLTTGPGLALTDLAESLHHGLCESRSLRQSPLALASLCSAVTYLLLENCPHRYSNELTRSAPLPAPRHVKWAIDFMHEHIAEPISLDDIAIAAKVSARTLQEGFRQFRNTTPMSYLHEIRMAAVHRDLLGADMEQSVAGVALKWGFTHFGRFARDYRKRFGQLPSQTLKR